MTDLHDKEKGKKKYNNNDDGYLNPRIAVDGKGSMWLINDKHMIQVGGKIKKAIAKVTNLTLWI